MRSEANSWLVDEIFGERKAVAHRKVNKEPEEDQEEYENYEEDYQEDDNSNIWHSGLIRF